MEIKKNLFRILFFIIFINIETNSFALTKNKIIVSVENQIISSYELKNKVKTMLFLSNQNLNQKNINFTKQQALQKLIDYKLKKNQIVKFNIQADNSIQINNHLSDLSSKYETDITGIKNIFKNNNLDFELYINEIKTEFNWQQLIFNKFRDKIVLDKKEIDNELNNLIETQSNLEDYQLAEIEISLKNNSEDKNTILEVNNQINKIGFEKTAIKYSTSTSSLDGGNIGWISSKSLSKKILAILDKMKIGDVSKPIIQTNTATIIKLLDKKTLNFNNIDLNELRQKIIKNKKNELLNLYSNNYLSKIKNNSLIEMR
jgi:peptidyl-prolyl cis-trans isomerase SurA